MLPSSQVMKLKAEIEQAATLHLNAIDIDTALSHYTGDMVAISNTTVFSSREELAAELSEYYNILKSVNHASWEDINIHVIAKTLLHSQQNSIMDLPARMVNILISGECGQLYLYLTKESGKYVYDMNHLEKYSGCKCKTPNKANLVDAKSRVAD